MDSEEAWTAAESGIELFNRGDFSEALELFVQSIKALPSEPSMHFNLALALAKLGENIVALEVLKKGLDLDPRDKHALKLLSMLYDQLKKRNQDPNAGIPVKFDWIGRFLKLKDYISNDAEFFNTNAIIAAIVASSVGFPYQFQTSAATGQRSTKYSRWNVNQLDIYHEDLIMCHARLSLPCLEGNSQEAITNFILENYEDLVDEDKVTGLLWVFEQGRRNYEDADYIEAARILEGLVAVEPTNLAILFYCGKALRDSGDMGLVQRSVDYYKRIMQLNYSNALGWYDLSLSYAILGDLQKELFCLQRAYDLGHSRQDIDRITYLSGITAPVDPFS